MVGADAPEKILKTDPSRLAKNASFLSPFLQPYNANKTTIYVLSRIRDYPSKTIPKRANIHPNFSVRLKRFKHKHNLPPKRSSLLSITPQ